MTMPESPTPLDVRERIAASVHEQQQLGKTAKSFAPLTNQPQEPLLKGEGPMIDAIETWTPPETFAQVLAKLPAERQASIRAKLDEQRAVMRERLGEEAEQESRHSVALRQWETAYFEIEARWREAAGRLLDLCTCASTPPTMPTYRTNHLPSCPASSAGVNTTAVQGAATSDA